MLLTDYDKKNIHSLMAVAVGILFTIQAVFSQSLQKESPDSAKQIVNDSLLPNLVIKVATYTAAIDHTDFLIRRKFNIIPISFNILEIEKKVKGFKLRLEKNGKHMNLRSLNIGAIMLKEILDDRSFYQRILTNFSNELTQSNGK
jgi:potassium efflux system protein